MYVQLIHFAVQQKLSQNCKAIILPIKIIEYHYNTKRKKDPTRTLTPNKHRELII